MADRARRRSLFLGTLVHSRTLDELEYLQYTAVCVDEKGIIVAIQPNCDQSQAEDSLYPRLGWSRGDVTVRTAKGGQFFFPGFIGRFCSLSRLIFLLIISRYSYSCLPVSKCGHLRQDHPPRLVEYVHFPYGKQSYFHRKSEDCVYSMHTTNPLSWDDHSVILRYDIRPINQPPRRPLPVIWPESFHRPMLHGHSIS
jgi:hypothetical protein